MHTERSHLTAWKDDFDGNPLSTQLVAKHLNIKEDILQGEFQPLLISIFAHFTCQELAWGTACCIRYMSLTHYKMNDNLWQSRNGSVTHRRTKTAPCSRALKWKIKFRTVTVFQNASWPCSATGRITIIQTLPSLYQHYSIRQLLGQLIPAHLWTVVSTPSCGCLPVAPPSDQ